MTPLEVAVDYRRRGWSPIPIKYKDKRCIVDNWPNLNIEEERLHEHFDRTQQNIGVLLGPPSEGLVDIDLDHPVAIALAPQFLPPTGAVFGRPGKPRSHWLYKSDIHKIEPKRLPDKKVVVEIRGAGQSVFPGSVHESGELIEWASDLPPAEVEAEDLLQAVGQLYEAALDEILIRVPLDYDDWRTGREETRAASVEDRARAYLSQMPGAISGQHGHATTFSAARALVWGFGLSRDKALEILVTSYNPRCQPPWTSAQFAHKVKDADEIPFGKPRGWLRDAENPQFDTRDYGAAGAAPSPPPVEPADPTQFRNLDQLWSDYPQLRAPIIDGLLRRGETMNVISATKIGKSWMAGQLALAVASGGTWLDSFQCHVGRVLIIDNELHGETLADRTKLLYEALRSRFQDPADVRRRVHIEPIRGRLIDFMQLEKFLSRVQTRDFDLIVLDAFYRFAINGTDENDNQAMAAAYNKLDSISQRLDCAFALIHHTSKGNQSGKAVTDVGAGAGSQSRAADSHVVLRHHKEQGVVVLDAAVRSWKPIEPVCIRHDFPLWYRDLTLDPEDLKPERPGRERKQQASATAPAGPAAWDAERFVAECCPDHLEPKSLVTQRATGKGLSSRAIDTFLDEAAARGLIFMGKQVGSGTKLFVSRKNLGSIFPS